MIRVGWTGTAHSLCIPIFSQLDYTKAGTCDKCYEKRNNVSKAAETCTCMVVFAIEKAFKVILRLIYGLRHPNVHIQVDLELRLVYSVWTNDIQHTHFQCSNFLSKSNQPSKGRLFSPHTSADVSISATVPGRRLFLLWPPKFPPEPPQIHGLQRWHADDWQEEKLEGSSSVFYNKRLFLIVKLCT